MWINYCIRETTWYTIKDGVIEVCTLSQLSTLVDWMQPDNETGCFSLIDLL